MTVRRTGIILLCLVMALLPASGFAADSFVMMGMEADTDTSRVWEDNLFFDRMEAITGVSFTFRQYNGQEAYQVAKDEAFASGDLPDVLFKASLTPEEEMAYYESGQLVDLAPYLEEHAPTLYGILSQREDWRDIITQPNGAITSLPVLSGSDRQCCIWINRDWLTALDLSMPTTVDEYTDVLRAIRDGDPNGNGKNDETPLSLLGPWEAKYFLHAFGIVANDYNIYLGEAGKVQFAPYESGYYDFVEWLALLQSENLIDRDAFRQSQSARSATLTTTEDNPPLVIGSLVSIAPYRLVDMDHSLSFDVLPPLKDAQGNQAFRRLLGGVGRGAFAVTSACEDVPAVLRWVDTLYTEEGARLAYAGEEGTDYTILADGTWKWNSNDDYLKLTEIVNRSIIADDVITPWLEPAAFVRNSEILADNHVRRQVDSIQSMLVDPFPVTWPTDSAREDRIATLQADIGTYLDTAIGNFAQGKTPLNEDTWAEFLAGFDELGIDEFLSLWQAKYDEAI